MKLLNYYLMLLIELKIKKEFVHNYYNLIHLTLTPVLTLVLTLAPILNLILVPNLVLNLALNLVLNLLLVLKEKNYE